VPATYIAFEKDPAQLQRRKVAAHVMGVGLDVAPNFPAWSELWAWLGNQWHLTDRVADRRILILDEITYAAGSDPAMLSSLQHAWDGIFRNSSLAVVLCGSHVRAMESIMSMGSPLFGRMTGQWHVQPFEFSVLKQALPGWTAEERVAAYAMVGGVPAYLDWLDPELDLVENIRKVVLNPGGMFMAEPLFLLYDELETIHTYVAIITSIGSGKHTLEEISNDALVGKSNLTAYLARLQQLRIVERRVPATVPPNRARIVRRGRYHLSDAYFRFYFELLAPRPGGMPGDREAALARIRANLRAFVGKTAFEQLAQQWVRLKGAGGALPMRPETVGQHWSKRVQIDVVAVNWGKRDVLVGECKWTEDRIDRQIVRDLIEIKAPKLLADLAEETGEAGWRAIPIFFARDGFTPAAQADISHAGGLAVDLAALDADLTPG
jgi:AAA+ ATPase superfamily predicted ATPase